MISSWWRVATRGWASQIHPTSDIQPPETACCLDLNKWWWRMPGTGEEWEHHDLRTATPPPGCEHSSLSGWSGWSVPAELPPFTCFHSPFTDWNRGPPWCVMQWRGPRDTDHWKLSSNLERYHFTPFLGHLLVTTLWILFIFFFSCLMNDLQNIFTWKPVNTEMITSGIIYSEWGGVMDIPEEHTNQLAFIRSKTSLEVRALGYMPSALGLCPEIFSVTLYCTVPLKGSWCFPR